MRIPEQVDFPQTHLTDLPHTPKPPSRPQSPFHTVAPAPKNLAYIPCAQLGSTKCVSLRLISTDLLSSESVGTG